MKRNYAKQVRTVDRFFAESARKISCPFDVKVNIGLRDFDINQTVRVPVSVYSLSPLPRARTIARTVCEVRLGSTSSLFPIIKFTYLEQYFELSKSTSTGPQSCNSQIFEDMSAFGSYTNSSNSFPHKMANSLHRKHNSRRYRYTIGKSLCFERHRLPCIS